MFIGLFLGGIAGGWALGGSSSNRHQGRQARAHGHGGLNRRIQQVEEELEAAPNNKQEGDSSTGASTQIEGNSQGSVLAGATIAVDPGHNGGNATHPEEINRPVVAAADGSTKACNTTGTETNDGNLTEAEFNFDVAEVLKKQLSALGAKVVMTRNSNSGVGPCINERAEVANRAGATASISIHADGNESAGAHGFDVIHPLPDQMVDPSIARPSLFLAKDVRDSLVHAGVAPANYVGKGGLDARDDLGGLNLTRVPAVLVELGNMRSAEEAAKLETPGYRSKLAAALASGLQRFLEEAQR